MSTPIRWQTACGVRFYRMGRTLIAEKGRYRFVATQYTDGDWEASQRSKDRYNMPIRGDVFSTLRQAIKYLAPHYREA